MSKFQLILNLTPYLFSILYWVIYYHGRFKKTKIHTCKNVTIQYAVNNKAGSLLDKVKRKASFKRWPHLEPFVLLHRTAAGDALMDVPSLGNSQMFP